MRVVALLDGVKPVSINATYKIITLRPRGRAPFSTLGLSTEAKELKDRVYSRFSREVIAKATWYSTSILIGGQLYNQDGTVKCWDVGNTQKLLVDAAFGGLKLNCPWIDDKQNEWVREGKVQSAVPFIRISVRAADERHKQSEMF